MKEPQSGSKGAPVGPSLAQSLGYHVRTLSENWVALLHHRTDIVGGSMPQWRYLRELWEEDGLSQRELSDRVGRQAATTVVAVRQLKRGGLVRTARSKFDRRKTQVFLTEKGRALHDLLVPLIDEVEDDVVQGISARDLAQFKRIMARMQQNIDAMAASQSRTARERLWQLMKDAQRAAVGSSDADERSHMTKKRRA
jgi:MarR family transcriptional regulator, organic hydroperoxide resistance regulator